MVTRRDVQLAAERLASEAWERREVPGELERFEEIRELARQQLLEDTFSTAGQRDRIGKAATGWIGHYDRWGRRGDDEDTPWSERDHLPIWPERTHEQLALEAGMQPFLDALVADDRVLIRLAFDGGLSQREIATQLGQSQSTVHRRMAAVLDQLRAALTRTFLGEGEESS